MVGDLSIASQQMVEIAKAVSRNADVVIMDEPTSALTEGKWATCSPSSATCARREGHHLYQPQNG